MSNMQGHERDGLQVQPELLDGEDDQKDVSTELLSGNPVRGALIAAGEMPAILRDLGLNDTALEADMAVSAVPVASDRPAPTTPNAQATATPNPYRAYQWALAAALALTCGTTRYFVAGSDASGSDTASANAVTLPSMTRIEPVDPRL